MVASGIGITPFLSQLRSPDAAGRDIVLVYAASSVEELAFAQELSGLGARVLVCTPADPLIPGWTWLGASVPDAAALAKAFP